MSTLEPDSGPSSSSASSLHRRTPSGKSSISSSLSLAITGSQQPQTELGQGTSRVNSDAWIRVDAPRIGLASSPTSVRSSSPSVLQQQQQQPQHGAAATPPSRMSHRMGFNAPATPVFSIGPGGVASTSADQGTAAAAAAAAGSQAQAINSSPRIGGGAFGNAGPSGSPRMADADYFNDGSEKYGAGAGSPSAMRVPLLADDGLGFTSPSKRGQASYSSLLYISPRGRIHPLLLVPAFVLGLLLASSGLFERARSVDWRAHGASGRDLASQSIYSIHSSGHLYLHPSSLDPTSVTSPIPASLAKFAPKSVRHPIYDLMTNATNQWETKLARQSKTLAQAVTEYKRRHNRKPPAGFDQWFKFAQDNNVVLIDEFDQTLNDVLPFYALPPETIHNRSMVLQRDPSTFTMQIRNGRNTIIGAHKADGRAKDQAELMKRWTKFLPDVNITMSAHDGPSIVMDHRGKTRHFEAAKKGVHLTQPEYDEVDEDAGLWGFPLSCPPNSRLRRAYDGLETNSLPQGPSYIADHLQTMNMCENPEWQYLHGFTSWAGMRPQLLRPLFSFAKMTLHSDILLTPLEQFWDYEQWDPKWEDKPNNKAVWRGTTTGVWFDRLSWWRSSQRVRLWFMGKDQTGRTLVRFDSPTANGDAIVERNVSTADLMQRYVDFAFTGKAGQCSEEDGSCQAVRDLFDFQRPFGWNEANEYKYMLDIDGNAWSGRFHRLLSSNSVVLKSTIFPEWYASWIQPWYHYIPLKVDYSDLFDIMAFFSGDLDGNDGHDDLAKLIADQGKEYTQKHWRYADMEASPDREAMSYDG
ncbi:hypothetical protein OIO90_003748 [Microbotryomycetes sp. JL221]|nr:hypothetical protein OIO90_003748 [Microbotryomycetes sp. JL221]